jgi:hypothetical protein
MWSQAGEGRAQALRRTTARVATSGSLDAPVVVVHARLLILGADSARLHEEIVTAGGALRKGRFSRLPAAEIEGALRSATEAPAPPAAAKDLVALWPGHREALAEALTARERERARSLKGELERRAAKEAANLEAILLELKAHIEAELAEGAEPQQLSLFGKDEREQLERNKASLKARAEAIPAEIQRETAALLARFATQTPRVFPVAVTYLVPPGFQGGA